MCLCADLMQAGLFYRAIMVNVRVYRWEQALKLALKHQTHVATVLWERRRFLARMQKEETDATFLQTSKDVKVDEEEVKRHIQTDMDAEGARQ